MYAYIVVFFRQIRQRLATKRNAYQMIVDFLFEGLSVFLAEKKKRVFLAVQGDGVENVSENDTGVKWWNMSLVGSPRDSKMILESAPSAHVTKNPVSC